MSKTTATNEQNEDFVYCQEVTDFNKHMIKMINAFRYNNELSEEMISQINTDTSMFRQEIRECKNRWRELR